MGTDELVFRLYEMQNSQKAPLGLFVFTRRGILAVLFSLWVGYLFPVKGFVFRFFAGSFSFILLYRFFAPHQGAVYAGASLLSRMRLLVFCWTGR